MNREQDKKHAQHVDAWIEQTLKGLPLRTQVLVFGNAIHAIHLRALQTLSIVTLGAILDRALHECQLKFPMLRQVRLSDSGLSFEDLLPSLDDRAAVEVTSSLRFFIVELLTILENITGGTLTYPLYAELSRVTYESSEKSKKDKGEV